MKKLLLSVFVLTGLLLNTSCKNDDDGVNPLVSANRIVVTIDGQPATFDNVFVYRDTYMEGGVEVTDIEVDALIGLDFTQNIYFGLRVGDTSSDALDYFYYDGNGIEYFYDMSNFNTTITVNDGTRLTMSFSGTLNAFTEEGEQTITLDNGLIDVVY